MKKNSLFAFTIVMMVGSLLTISGCRKQNNAEDPKPIEKPQGPYWTAMPTLPVSLECSLADIEKAEKGAKSTERKRISQAGYTLIEYNTIQKDQPIRTYLIKESTGKLFSGALIYVVDDKIWKSKEELDPDFIKAFTSQGYQLRVIVSANGEKRFSFYKGVKHDVYSFLICTIDREGPDNRYTKEANTQIAFSFGDVVGN